MPLVNGFIAHEKHASDLFFFRQIKPNFVVSILIFQLKLL